MPLLISVHSGWHQKQTDQSDFILRPE